MRFYWLEKDNPTAAWGEGVLGLVFTELRPTAMSWPSGSSTPSSCTPWGPWSSGSEALLGSSLQCCSFRITPPPFSALLMMGLRAVGLGQAELSLQQRTAIWGWSGTLGERSHPTHLQEEPLSRREPFGEKQIKWRKSLKIKGGKWGGGGGKAHAVGPEASRKG